MKNTRLPPHLEAAQIEIEGYAREYGLDFFPTIYEVLDYRTLYETASLGGFPTRYPHWRFGMEYDQLLKGHIWLGSTIYEMVINTDPSYAYLLEGNETVTQKMVMAHVTAHVDFFKNNMWFAHTNRKMLDEMANHASRIQLILERYGYDIVEDFIDTCLSLDNLIDFHAPYIKRPEVQVEEALSSSKDDDLPTVEGLKVDREYMREYINPPEFLEEQRKKLDQDRVQQKRFPANPQKDILLFLLNYAPLERWQHTVLNIIRDEAYYFAPQGMTKILNEGWACLTEDALLYTDRGMIPIQEIVQQRVAVQVNDGETLQQVYDWATFEDRETVWLRTRRGLELEGSVTHRVMLSDGSWRPLGEVQQGDVLRLSPGMNLWATDYVTIDRLPNCTMLLQDHAVPVSRHSAVRDPAIAQQYDEAVAVVETLQPIEYGVAIPPVLDEAVAEFLGCVVGAGSVSADDGTINLTVGDEEQADRFIALVRQLFGLEAQKQRDSRGWNLRFLSRDVAGLLVHVGMQPDGATYHNAIPDAILRSPKSVVVAFLRAVCTSRGDVGESGIICSTSSEKFGKTVQLLLLNLGILSSRHTQTDDSWNVSITGRSVSRFEAEIGFSLPARQDALARYLADRQRFDLEDWDDEVVARSYGRANVYDVSVTDTHRYAAQGFINHNSYWHSEIMTKRAVLPSEIISFADLHSGVVATSSGRLNPYKVGLELLRDIEDRWNKGKFGKAYEECDDIAEKRNWDKQLGLGRQKIFEIRKLYNDVNFIDEFLTPEFVLENNMFSFRYNRDTDTYEIASREFKEIKEKLLFQLTNFGQPFIYVEDANYNNRGELYLRHRHEGVDLQMNYARDTMRNLYKIWTRPIYVETLMDERKRLLCFDGKDFSERRMD